jgi:hypothetical protein
MAIGLLVFIVGLALFIWGGHYFGLIVPKTTPSTSGNTGATQ